MSKTATAFEMGLREYARMPVLLALFVFLPAYFILVFTNVMPDQPISVDIPVQGIMQVEMTSVVPVLMTPMATALIGGAAGLFLMQSAREVDGRLSLTGLGVPSLIVARSGVLAVASVAAGLVSMGILSLSYLPQRIGWFLVATVLTGLLYGGIGVLIGLALNRLAGIYVLMFGPLLDIFLAQSPLTQEGHAIAPYLPSHYPMQLAFDAAFSIRVELTNLWLGLGYLVVLWLVAAGAFYRRVRI
jgi:ABC-2 type transport system permease protein